jgi:hypothetical protein
VKDPANPDGSIILLAHMPRFIVADMSDASGLMHELQVIVPTSTVPMQPIIAAEQKTPCMFDFFLDFRGS